MTITRTRKEAIRDLVLRQMDENELKNMTNHELERLLNGPWALMNQTVEIVDRDE